MLGVLIEKGMTTPDQYPLTLNALVTGCNQKSNREPVSSYTDSQVEEALQSMIAKGLAANATGFSGRVERFSSQMGRVFELRGVEIAVLGELLLRGAQSEGELRARASRMKPIADLGELAAILERLASTSPPFVVRLTPSGVSRGVRWTHGFYPEPELLAVIARESHRETADDAEPAPRAPAAAPPGEIESLRARIAALEARVGALERGADAQ